MVAPDRTDRIMQIVEMAEARFGLTVEAVTSPGGGGRGSFRLHFADRTMIASTRTDPRRTRIEAFVLKRLHTVCNDVPECLALVGDVLFQSDVGSLRLSQAMNRAGPSGRTALAARAVAGLFRIQSAARQTDLDRVVPRLGQNIAWVQTLISAIETLVPFSRPIPSSLDRVAISDLLLQPSRQFVKWDCRSGNAALRRDKTVGWFDFEFAGLRHGAEDLAWLIGDETWPMVPGDMLDLVVDAFDPGCGHRLDEYLNYLSVYTTFHCAYRLHLVLRESRQRGWLAKDQILKRDQVGVHPDYAAQLCRVGGFFSARSPLTRALTGNFGMAERAIRGTDSAELLASVG